MSFAYMPLYIGDYLRDTQHLSCSEHGIYLKLLMHCWSQQGPAPLDERKLLGIVNARNTDEIEALRRVLSEFFVAMSDGYYNKRLQEEIERSSCISGKRSGAANARWRARETLRSIASHDANALQVQSKSIASAPSPSPSPSQDKEKRNTTRASRTSPSIPGLESVSEQVLSDWMAHRKEKRAKVTATAVRGIQREADKAGVTLEAALAMCCARGWTGFKADWVNDSRPNGNHSAPMTTPSNAAAATAAYLRSQELTPEQRAKAADARSAAIAAMRGMR